MPYCQVYGEYEHIPNVKSDADLFFYQLLLFVGDTLLLGGVKLRDEALDLSWVDMKYFGSEADADFILDYGHELWVDLLM